MQSYCKFHMIEFDLLFGLSWMSKNGWLLIVLYSIFLVVMYGVLDVFYGWSSTRKRFLHQGLIILGSTVRASSGF